MLAALRVLGISLATSLAAMSVQAGPANLVNNGGFETGDFTSWTQIGNTTFNGVACAPGFAFEGNCASFFGPIVNTGGISQTVTGLAVGTNYTVSFELQNSADAPSSVLVTLGASNLLNLTNPPSTGAGLYKKYEFNVAATSASEALVFSFRNDPGFFTLDSVSVTVAPATVPEPASLALMGIALVGLAATRRRKQ